AAVRQRVGRLGSPHLARAMLVAADEAGDDLAQLRANLKTWLDNSLERVSGKYKRTTQYWLLGIGFVMALSLDVNSLAVARELWTNKPLRESVARQAEAVAKDPEYQKRVSSDTGRATDIASTRAELDNLGLPIGWTPARWKAATKGYEWSFPTAWA